MRFPSANSILTSLVIFHNHVAVPASGFWNSNRSGIHAGICVVWDACRDVGMSVQQNVPAMQWRQVLFIIRMAVGGINQRITVCNGAVICHNGKLEYHLVDFGIAVAPDTENMLFFCVEQFNHLFWIIFFRQIIARTVV